MVNKNNKELCNEIRKYKFEMIEETAFLFAYTLKTYIYSLISFGIGSMVTSDVKNILYEIANINRFELKILNFIKSKVNHIDNSVAFQIIDEMNEDKSLDIEYYYQVLDDIDDAIDMKKHLEQRGLKKKISHHLKKMI